MKYVKSQMKELVKDSVDLQERLQKLMKEMDLEKNFRFKSTLSFRSS